MHPNTPAFDLASRFAGSLGGREEPRLTPVQDLERGEGGVLVESSLERVAIFTRNDALRAADVTRMRHVMARVQARRAVLYVPFELPLASPVRLLATLSKIQVVRLPRTALDRPAEAAVARG